MIEAVLDKGKKGLISDEWSGGESSVGGGEDMNLFESIFSLIAALHNLTVLLSFHPISPGCLSRD